jgi:hypothetical protein
MLLSPSSSFQYKFQFLCSWDSLFSQALEQDHLLIQGTVKHYVDHRFRADVCVLTIHVPVPLPTHIGWNSQCPCLLPLATFTPSLLAGTRYAGDRRAVLGAIILDVTKTCFEMFAGTIMCYGQTGAGKTYTMTGATENYKHRGILPRALQQVESGPVGGIPHKSPHLSHRCC